MLIRGEGLSKASSAAAPAIFTAVYLQTVQVILLSAFETVPLWLPDFSVFILPLKIYSLFPQGFLPSLSQALHVLTCPIWGSIREVKFLESL
jgi:hypothetical protein